MATIWMPDASVGDYVSIGPYSHIVDADIGDNALIGSRVGVQRGAQQHGLARVDIPMNRQGGETRRVTIGDDVWIGTGAVILADVASGSVVGAGAVVTRTFEPYSVLAGVPAKVLRRRGPQLETDLAETAAA